MPTVEELKQYSIDAFNTARPPVSSFLADGANYATGLGNDGPKTVDQRGDNLVALLEKALGFAAQGLASNPTAQQQASLRSIARSILNKISLVRYYQGRKLYENREWAAAGGRYDQVFDARGPRAQQLGGAALSPHHRAAFYRAFARLQQAGVTQDTLDAYEAATAGWPQNVAGHYWRAFHLFGTGDHDGALASVTQALTLDPSHGPSQALRQSILTAPRTHPENLYRVQIPDFPLDVDPALLRVNEEVDVASPYFRTNGAPVSYKAVFEQLVRGHRAMQQENYTAARAHYGQVRTLVGAHGHGAPEFGGEAQMTALRDAIRSATALQAQDLPRPALWYTGRWNLTLDGPSWGYPHEHPNVQGWSAFDVHLLLIKHIYIDLLFGDLHLAVNEYDEALKCFQRVVTCSFVNPHAERAFVKLRLMEAHQALADQRYAQNELELAFAEYSRILALYPAQSATFFGAAAASPLANRWAVTLPFGDVNDTADRKALRQAIVSSDATLATPPILAHLDASGIDLGVQVRNQVLGTGKAVLEALYGQSAGKPPGTWTTNPAALQRMYRAAQALVQIRAGLNFLGYREDFAPVWRFDHLLQNARYFAEHAKQAERDFLNWRERAEAEHERRRQLAQQLSTQSAQVEMEALRIREARDQKKVVDASLSGISARSRALDTLEDRTNDKAAFDGFMSVVQGGISGGQMGAAAGGGGAAVGALIGMATAGYGAMLTQAVTDAQFDLQRTELAAAAGVASRERTLADTRIDMAKASFEMTVLAREHMRENLAELYKRPLSAEYWWQLAQAIRENARRYLRDATHLAFLAEQAYEFEVERRVNVIKLDYSRTPNADVLAGDYLLGDLDMLKADELINQGTKSVPIKFVLSLAARDPIGFAELKRTGRMSFETTMPELDQAFPGIYHAKIANVEVSVFALSGVDGVRGTLSHAGYSLVRTKLPPGVGTETTLAPEERDWLVDASATGWPFRVKGNFHDPETMVLSSYAPRQDGALLPTPSEMYRLFEGLGAAGGWTLELPRASNTFDFSTLADVRVAFYLSARYSDAVAAKVATRLAALRAADPRFTMRRRTLSTRAEFPDQWYALKNPAAGATERVLELDVRAVDFPYNEVNRRLREVAVYLSFAGPLAQPVVVPVRLAFGGVTATVQASTVTQQYQETTPSGPVARTQTVPADPRAKLFTSEIASATDALHALDGDDPTGVWKLTLVDADLAAAGVDPDDLTEVLLGLQYGFDLP